MVQAMQALRRLCHRQTDVEGELGYFGLGGMHLQVNLVGRETLIDAQEHPDKHRDLMVRVAGYSAYFVDLTKEVQDEIIARTEHAA